MTQSRTANVPFVRARQRSRTALKAFEDNLAPAIDDVGIDRLQVTVTGTWRMTQSASDRDVDAAIEHLATPPPEVDWFKTPADSQSGRTLSTSKQRMPSTIGSVEFFIGRPRNGVGFLQAKFVGANPTRTLAHLLADFAESPNFIETLASLGPYRFFRRASRGVRTGYGDNGDNWISDRDQAVHHLGRDIFGAFLPIYVMKLQELVTAVLAPSNVGQYESDGADIVVSDGDLTCRWDWANVRVPQIECYFERHHSRAVGFVRDAASIALSDLDKADARRYENYESVFVQRAGDCLTLTTPLNQTKHLKIYAKSRRCIRFEIVRNGKGDYSELARPVTPHDRLLGILELERGRLLEATDWPRVGETFVERDGPQMDDLARLCGIVADVCHGRGLSTTAVLNRLLEGGGCDLRGGSDLPEAVILDLTRLDVLRHHTFRRRSERNAPRRYTLTPAYRNMVLAIQSTFLEPDNS